MNMRAREELNKIGKITWTGNNFYTFIQIVDKILAHNIYMFLRE